MSTTNPTNALRLVWLLTGTVLGAVSLGSILWARGWIPTAPTDASVDPSTSTAAGGMDTETGSGADMAMGPTESVRITPDQIQRFGITFGEVEERTLEARIRTVGVVAVDETRLVEITTKFPGYVERLYADYTGKTVEAGSPLLDIYAPDLVAAQEEVLLARNLQATVGAIRLPGVTSEPVDLEATALRRLSLWDIGDDQITALLSEGRPSRTLSLSAPISGVVLEKSVVPGSAFRAGQTLFRLADLSEVWIDIEIRETDARLVRPGSRADVALAAYPGESFSGAVDFVYPTVDERTRAVRARLVAPNLEGRIRPGMYATVLLTTPRQRALSVPFDAVVWTGDRTLLFVEEEGGRIRPVEAELGATVGEYVVVLAGVEPGQRVVASAQYLIDAEANIGAIMRSMMSMLGAGDMAEMDMGETDMDDMEQGDSSGMEGMEMPGDSTSASSNRQGR